MNELITRLASDPLTQILSLLTGIIGILLAFYFFRKGQRIVELRFDYTNHVLVENLSAKLQGLEIRFGGVPQPRITVTRIAFWNAGTETIRETDTVALAPLQLSITPESTILDTQLIYESDKTSQIRLEAAHGSGGSSSDGSQTIKFDYLDPGQGGVVQLVHTGGAASIGKLSGKLKGGRAISKSEAIAYRRAHWFGPLAPLVRWRPMGWFGTLTYSGLAALSLILAIMRVWPWYCALLAPLLAGISWIYYRAYVSDILPMDFGRHLLGATSSGLRSLASPPLLPASVKDTAIPIANTVDAAISRQEGTAVPVAEEVPAPELRTDERQP